MHLGNILVCTDTVHARCLEMCNPNFDIKPGDRYFVTDKDDYPNDNKCYWYELTSADNEEVKIIKNPYNIQEIDYLKYLKDLLNAEAKCLQHFRMEPTGD